MKKIATLVLLCCLLLCACTGRDPAQPNDVPADADTTAAEQTAGDGAELSYKDIERVSAARYTKTHYGFQSDKSLIRISYPVEWQFIENSKGSFSIYRENREIGELIGAYASDTDQWTALVSQNATIEGGAVSMKIEKNGEGASARFRYRVVYEYITGSELRAVTLVVDCAEVSSMTEVKLFADAQVVENASSETLGLLTHIQKPCNVLILGNSFVGSSQIGSILSELLSVNQKTCNVTAISRGMASVYTYADDADMMETLARGTYDVLFMCGFYSSGAVDKLKTIVEACEKSGTVLVIFPAHNESSDVVSSACTRYKNVYCINWKAELDRLISTGVSRWDLCVDDTYDHSKPLAGYVGSHMIYRALYGESPKNAIQNSLSQTYIDGILGNYAQVGDTKMIDDTKITYFPQSVS